MKITRTFIMPINLNWLLLSIFFTLFIAAQSVAQEHEKKPFTSELTIKLLTAEVTRFDKPIRIGPGERAIEYQEALVLKIQANREQLDSLPPSIAPFLYIGQQEYRIFNVDRDDKRETLILSFHIRNWEKLQDGDPVVLTIAHGAPIRNPEKFNRQDIPRLSKGMIIDLRERTR